MYSTLKRKKQHTARFSLASPDMLQRYLQSDMSKILGELAVYKQIYLKPICPQKPTKLKLQESQTPVTTDVIPQCFFFLALNHDQLLQTPMPINFPRSLEVQTAALAAPKPSTQQRRSWEQER